jgi:hypothetical protein
MLVSTLQKEVKMKYASFKKLKSGTYFTYSNINRFQLLVGMKSADTIIPKEYTNYFR